MADIHADRIIQDGLHVDALEIRARYRLGRGQVQLIDRLIDDLC